MNLWTTARFRAGDGGVIRRRDRSLGGKEVVVSKREEMNREANRLSLNPLSSDEEILEGVSDTFLKNWPRKSRLQKLPSWWPLSHSTPYVAVDKQEYQQKANRLLRAKFFSNGSKCNTIRPFVTGSLQTFYKLDDPELIPESDKKENRRPQAANRGLRRDLRR